MPRVGRDEAEVVAEPGRPLDVRRTAVQRDRDEEVERHLALVVADQPAALAVDLACVELRDELDVLLAQEPREVVGGDRLRERRVERRDETQLDVVPDTALVEVPVGEEGELERGDRALDRQVDEVDDDPSRIEGLQRPCECLRALRRVEGEDFLHPARACHPLRLLRLQTAARRDDERVVREGRPVGEEDRVGFEVDAVDIRLVERDPVPELPAAGAHDVLDVGQAERHEQQARLVDVAVVPVDDRDLRLVGLVGAPEPVRHHRAAGAAAEDHDSLLHRRHLRRRSVVVPPTVPARPRRRIREGRRPPP